MSVSRLRTCGSGTLPFASLRVAGRTKASAPTQSLIPSCRTQEVPVITRRNFIVASGMTALASTRVFGANDKLRVGVIGAGHRMKGLLDSADKAGAYEIVAVCDVYGPNRDAIVQRSKGLATAHLDYREVLD